MTMPGSILIVDDEERNLKLMEAMLIPEGYNVLKASTGEECIEMLNKEEFEMVLLDVMLPGISGYEVLQKIRSEKKTSLLPVILLTALIEKTDKIKGIKLEADDFLSKPFDREELLARVNTHMKLSSLRSQLSQKERLLKIIKKMDEGVIITTNNYKPLIINRFAKELLDIESEPEHILFYMQSKYPDSFDKTDMKTEFILKRPETQQHKPLYVSVKRYVIKKKENEIDSYVLFLRDVTKKYLENRLQYDFLSLISHKLNTPLAGISGLLYILNSEIKDDKLKTVVTEVEHQKNRLVELIKRLLYFLDIESRSLKEEVNKNEIPVFIEFLKKQYNMKNLQIQQDIKVNKIRRYHKFIIEELLDNAFKYFSGEKLEIKLNVNEKEIYVADNGQGIAPEERKKIFEPFYQIEKYFTGQVAGVGMGLTIVKRLTELFKGKIYLESKIDSGTSICIIFPKQN